MLKAKHKQTMSGIQVPHDNHCNSIVMTGTPPQNIMIYYEKKIQLSKTFIIYQLVKNGDKYIIKK